MKFIAKRVLFTRRYMFRLNRAIIRIYIKNIKIRKMSYYVLYY